MFEIALTNPHTVPCITPEGRIDTVNSQEFDRAVQQHIEKNQFIILDFGRCNYLSSTGIRVLLSTFKKLTAKGGMLYICQIQPEVYQVLELAGLHSIFRFTGSIEEACNEIDRSKNNHSDSCEIIVNGHPVVLHLTPGEGHSGLLWENDGIAGYNELAFAFGKGYGVDQPGDDDSATGLFVSTGKCSAFIPDQATIPPDFRIPLNPAHAGIEVKKALSFHKEPIGWVRMFTPAELTLQQLTDAIIEKRSRFLTKREGALAFVAISYNPSHHSISCGLIVDEYVERIGLLDSREVSMNGCCLAGATFECEELLQPTGKPSPESMLNEMLTLENITNVKLIDDQEILTYPLIWVFAANGLEQAAQKRISLELPDEGFEPAKSFLVRRLYTDSSRVVVKALHGGYSAQTFEVSSYDKDGRKLRPTVMKIASRNIISREAERCQKYASPYILNNSAQVLGTEFFGDLGALRYNFVGIGGEQTQLKWLTHYFDSWPVGKLTPIFDKIFTQILNPWYGQPVSKNLFPFTDHDPTATFFPHIYKTAEQVFAISCEEPAFVIESTGQRLTNPYWFLKHEYPKRKLQSAPYPTSICHGDLNMQNILLDQDMNIYLIDFSETRPRAVVSDFARLEAIFMVERAPLNNEQDMNEMIAFARKLYSIEGLDQFPENNYKGDYHEIVERNVALTRKMREYALHFNEGMTNPAPYYLALLEWVLPIVCFTVSPLHKRFSMIVAGMLCEQVSAFLDSPE